MSANVVKTVISRKIGNVGKACVSVGNIRKGIDKRW